MNYKLLSLLFIISNFFIAALHAQKIYTTDVSQVNTQIRKGHLNLGGKNVNGKTIEVNNFYVERDGKPAMPVIGEFHYSRYPNMYWDEEIKKMKAGGITIIATYIFWNIHEAKEGKFDWDGDLNLRKFVELCKANNMEVLIRIGPFDHGEIRNGGLPDWLYGRPFEVRSNDSAYLNYVKILYDKISEQVKGLFFKDGGPIVGVQLENEYQASAAPWAITYEGAEREYTAARSDRKIVQHGVGINKIGNDHIAYGQEHMQTLKKMAMDAGMIAPIYTATGWGFAAIVNNGSIPVMSCYAYPYWEPGNAATDFYLFKDIHKNPDYAPVSYKADDYPSLAAEIGTGMCVSYNRRPRVRGESLLPLMIRMLGSGTNGLGYYMYHGGSTPSNGFYFYTEGFGLNLKSYDYQAPLGEFGSPSLGFYSLKIVNSFLKNYGDKLAPLFPIIPETNKNIVARDSSTLRYAVRSDGDKGFVFMHNFQDHVNTVDLKELQVKLKTKNGEISIPENGTMTLKSEASAILPFNMDFIGITFKYATVQPLLAFVNDGVNYQVFFSINGIIPELVLKGEQKVYAKNAEISKKNGNTVITGLNNNSFEVLCNNVHFLVIPFEKALNAYVVGSEGKKNLLISDAMVLEDGENLQMIIENKENWSLEVYPAITKLNAQNATIALQKAPGNILSAYSVQVEKQVPNVVLKQYDDRHYVLDASKLDLLNLNDVYVNFDYKGDRVMCMLNGELAADNLYTSQPWRVGLKKYAQLLKEKEMYFYFYPMKKNAPYLSYLDKDVIPDFSKADEILEIKQPEIIPEYKVVFNIR